MKEIVEKRGRKYKTFDLGGGRYRLETGCHSHTHKNGLWLPTDSTVEAETGVDTQTGRQYKARSRFERLDYDIRFGKKDPVWMKVKHLPTGKTIVFDPKANKTNPEHTVVDNKIFVSQAWDGIDMEIFVSDKGTKTNYIITSPAGQRVIEFNVSGDLSSFKVAAPWYRGDTGLIVVIPSAFRSGVMSYDFRQVPVGTVVDPTVSIPGSFADNWVEINAARASYTWAQALAFSSGDLGSAAASTEYLAITNSYDATYWYIYRALMAFDTSGVEASMNIDSANLKIVQAGSQTGTNILKLYTGTFALPIVGAGINDFTAACSDAKTATLTDFIAITDTSAIIKAGTTKIMVRNHKDWTETEPTSPINYACYSSDAYEPDYRPTLTVEYSEASSGGPSPATFGEGKRYPFASWRGWR